MQRILFWVILLIAAQWWWRRSRREAQAGRDPATPTPGQPAQGGKPRAATLQLPERMVRCSECGAHAPLSDSVATGQLYFCSRVHALRHAARHAGSDAR